MADFARSANAHVQAQLDRLSMLSPAGDRLGLERIGELLERLGRPQDRLPPVFHVAGTNGKGSVCAFLRAGLEAAGHEVHVFTSPHLVRFNERIRIAGRLIEDDRLAALLDEVLDVSSGIEPCFF
jgi:dihydrofolate synthase/folylpolyglutamate synthase